MVAIMQSQAEWAAAKQRFPILPPRGEEAKSKASIPHGLQNSLATGGVRETLHNLQRRSVAILIRNAAVKCIATILFGSRLISASACKAP